MIKLILNHKIPQKTGGEYMTRWGIMSDWLTIYLHRYVDGDGDRDMHDHPWHCWFSFVIRGWISERREYPGDWRVHIVDRRTFSLCGCSGNVKHRIWYAMPGTWTLFIGWRRVREWGFIDKRGVKKIYQEK